VKTLHGDSGDHWVVIQPIRVTLHGTGLVKICSFGEQLSKRKCMLVNEWRDQSEEEGEPSGGGRVSALEALRAGICWLKV
jgi:hypothetical protein